jgi:hypothetical protein
MKRSVLRTSAENVRYLRAGAEIESRGVEASTPKQPQKKSFAIQHVIINSKPIARDWKLFVIGC